MGGLGSPLVVVLVPLASSASRQEKGFSLLPPCFSSSRLPAVSPGLMSAGEAFWGITRDGRGGGQAELIRGRRFPKRRGFPLRTCDGFHLKTTKH